LRTNFELEDDQVFRGDGPVNLSRVMFLYNDVQRPDLKFLPFTPHALVFSRKATSIFEDLRTRDILLHHPYDSYDPVVNFIELGAQDPNVVSIKQTLYRTSSDSPMFQAITEAAATKEATLVVELMARFDEASNIRWARDLEDAGVQVFHGLVGLKTHCKLSLLARRDPDGVTRRYAHIGTGNYNATTARIYTDLSLLTADPEITGAVHDVFSFLTAYAENPTYRPLLVAPLDLAEKLLALIEREADHARHGRPARIIAKMNALLDKKVILALYQASQAGVEIDLLVRGICALRPGVRGVSDRIKVRSIVGRFLEHSRIYYFGNGGDEEVYIGSADWMPRNLYERVEVLTPLKDSMARERVRYEILEAYLADNLKTRILAKDGSYHRVWQKPGRRGGKPPAGAAAFNAQEFLIGLAEGKHPLQAIPNVPSHARRRSAMRKEA
jgi:polyphosphate kinase